MRKVQAKILHWALGISIATGLLVLLDQLQLSYFLYYPRSSGTILVSSTLDLCIFLVSSASVPLILLFSPLKTSIVTKIGIVTVWTVSFILTALGQTPGVEVLYVILICVAILDSFRQEHAKMDLAEIIVSSLVVIVLIEFSCLFYWIVASINPHGMAGVMSEQLESNLTFSLYPFAIPFFLLLLFSWLWAPLISRLGRLQTKTLVVRYRPSTPTNVRMVAASLDLFAIIALIVFVYPYLAGQSWIVGVDSHLRYLDPLNSLTGLPLSEAIRTSYTHGIYVSFLYLIETTTGLSAFTLVKYVPLILAFTSAVAAYFAILRAGCGVKLAILSSICVLLWFPATLGIYGGIQANWVAVIFWMLFLSIYFTRTNWNLLKYGILSCMSLIILLVHPWTWGVFATTLGLAAILLRKTVWRQHCFRAVVAAVIIAAPVGVLAYGLLPGLNSDFSSTIQLYFQTAAKPNSILTFGQAVVELFFGWASFLSPMILLLSLVGTSALLRRQGIFANYLLAWIATWCVGSILVAPLGYNLVNTAISETGLWRMLYVSPLPFLLAFGCMKCIEASRVPDPEDIPIQHSRLLQIACIALLLALGGGLFAFWQVYARLLIVILAIALSLLFLIRFPRNEVLQMLVVTVLLLLVVNAAFRSLFPLLLDPHNLFSAVTR